MTIVVREGRPWHVCDPVIATLAGRQDGIVTRAQLLAGGVTRDEIDHRVRGGRLFAVYRGVYAVGHQALSPHARIRAAIYAAGAHAAASHSTATYVHDLTHILPAVLEVTIAAGHRRGRPGLVIHRSDTIETTTRHGLRVTTVARTLKDLGWPDALVSEALARRLIRREDLPSNREFAPTESELERRMRRLCARAGLPQPICQYPIGPYRIDFAWPEHRVLVETDGYATHGHRQAFEDDRARDAYLIAQGYIVIRFTWRQIIHEPTRVAARLGAALALNASTPVAP